MVVNMKVWAIIFVICFEKCCALYFHMGETEKKCFLEEIPDETMVTGKKLLAFIMGLSFITFLILRVIWFGIEVLAEQLKNYNL